MQRPHSTAHSPLAKPTARGAGSRICVLRPRRAWVRILLVTLIIAVPLFTMGACVRHFLLEPFTLWGEQKPPEPAPPIQPAVPGAPYPLQTAPPYTVALDAGHGGGDTGAQGLMNEVEVCEATTNALFSLLAADTNFHPVRTRNNGMDLSTKDRAMMSTAYQASLLLSIHANHDGQTSQSHGFECFPTPPGRLYSEQSLQFAQCLVQSMQAAGHRLRGENGIRFLYYTNGGHTKNIVESSDTKVRSQKSFGMVEKPGCPAVLAEQCFISNAADVEQWASASGCAKTARAYYEAICAYFGTQPVSPTS